MPEYTCHAKERRKTVTLNANQVYLMRILSKIMIVWSEKKKRE